MKTVIEDGLNYILHVMSIRNVAEFKSDWGNKKGSLMVPIIMKRNFDYWFPNLPGLLYFISIKLY